MIALDAVSKGYGGQSLLREVSWRIGRGERIGLCGPNGTGKTTLCRILAGVEDPDSGRVHRDTGVSVGYLPQEVGASEAGTVLAEALSGFDEVWRLEAELERLAALMAAEDAGPELTERYGEVQHRFEALGGYRLEAEAKIILGGLGFASTDAHRPLGEFSGGWRMRAALARLLLLRPDLLLLDEPTNHLDLESLAWLESFLSSYAGSVVVVSHDRYFLNRMVTSIAEMAEGAVTLYVGDYDHYLVEREARHALLEARQRNQAKRVAEIERFIDRFRYQATKARQVQSRVKMLEKVERIEVGASARRIHFAFPQPPRSGRVSARLHDIYKAYGGNVVYAGADFSVERGQRVALVGINGAGKSTLLKMLAGVLPFDRGERTLGANVAVHYYAQHQLDALDPSRTVLEELEQADPVSPVQRLRSILGSRRACEFHGYHRLHLARPVLHQPHRHARGRGGPGPVDHASGQLRRLPHAQDGARGRVPWGTARGSRRRRCGAGDEARAEEGTGAPQGARSRDQGDHGAAQGGRDPDLDHGAATRGDLSLAGRSRSLPRRRTGT